MALSNSAQGLGIMMSAGIQASASPTFRRDLQNGEMTTPALKGMPRAQLIGALSMAVVNDYYVCRIWYRCSLFHARRIVDTGAMDADNAPIRGK
jgi:hypothetical protein